MVISQLHSTEKLLAFSAQEEFSSVLGAEGTEGGSGTGEDSARLSSMTLEPETPESSNLLVNLLGRSLNFLGKLFISG